MVTGRWSINSPKSAALQTQRIADRLRAILTQKLEKDTLQLPVFPEVAAESQRLLRNENTDIQVVADLIKKDPLLAAQVMRVANSPFYKGQGSVTALLPALTRLGSKSAIEVLQVAIAHTVFMSNIPGVRRILRMLWEHALAVGVLARELGRTVGVDDADEAFLAGLLHNIGTPVAAAYLGELERAMSSAEARRWIDEARWLEVVDDLSTPIGVALAKAWALPEAVTDTIQNPREYDHAKPTATRNLVLFVNALTKQAGMSAGPVKVEELAEIVETGQALIGMDKEIIDGLKEKTRDGNWKALSDG